jgi:hypothetical protein
MPAAGLDARVSESLVAPSAHCVGVVDWAGTSAWSGIAARVGSAACARVSTKTKVSQAAGRPGFVFFCSPNP